MLFHLLLAILGGGLPDAAIPPPVSPASQPASLARSASSVSLVSDSFNIDAASPGNRKGSHIARSKLNRSARIASTNGRNQDAPASPQSTQATGDWSPQCPQDNHALASINSPDLKIEYRFALECNKDRIGSDMPGMPIDQPDWYSCAKACVDAYGGGAGCLSFAWRHDSSKCFLKNIVPPQSDFAEGWSAVLSIVSEDKRNSTDAMIGRLHPSDMDAAVMKDSHRDATIQEPRGTAVMARSSDDQAIDSEIISLEHGVQATYDIAWGRRGGELPSSTFLATSPIKCVMACYDQKDACKYYSWEHGSNLCSLHDSTATRFQNDAARSGELISENAPVQFSSVIKPSSRFGGEWKCPQAHLEIATIAESHDDQIFVTQLECDIDRPSEDAMFYPLDDPFAHADTWELCLHKCFKAEVTGAFGGCSAFSFRANVSDSAASAGCYLKKKTVGDYAPPIHPLEGVWSGVLLNLNHPFHGDSVFPTQPSPAPAPNTSTTSTVAQPVGPKFTCPGNDTHSYWLPFSTPNYAYKYLASLECGINRAGGDSGLEPITNVESWEECAEACKNHAVNGCVAFTWHSSERNCRLKMGQVPVSQPEEGAWSGVLQVKET